MAFGKLGAGANVTNASASITGILPLTPTRIFMVVGNGANNGGSNWSNIAFDYIVSTNTIRAACWITGTGKIISACYIAIGTLE